MKRPLKVTKEALQGLLPPLPADFERGMRELILSMPAEEQKEREQPMKRKFSVGLAVALVLSLLAVSALAAVLLGGKDFVDQIMAPKAMENPSSKFTNAEVTEILRIAQENNLTLSDEDMYLLTHLDERRQEGYYKEELMRRFVKTEYGFYPSAWPIEVQHWYEQLVKACGLEKGRQVNVLPQGDEIPQERAVEIAENLIHEKYDPNAPLNDRNQYIRFLQYHEEQHGPGNLFRRWYFSYEAQDLYGADYFLTLDSQGNILNEYSVDGIGGTSYTARGMFMMDRFKRVYGDQFGAVNWNSELLLTFQEAMRRRLEKEPDFSFQQMEEVMLYQTYLLPDDTMLSREAAIAAAKAACGEMRYETVYADSQMAVCMEIEERPVWKVTLKIQDSAPAYVELDAHTGEALTVAYDPLGDTDAWRPYVSEAYWQENSYHQRAARRRAQEGASGFQFPAFWHSDGAPEGYWEWIDQVGFTEETMEDLYVQWGDDYGWNTDFWPLEAQAIDYLLHALFPDADLSKVTLPGHPQPGDLSREKALAIAKDAFRKEFSDDLPGMDVSPLTGAFRFWIYNYYEDHRSAWEVILLRPDGSEAGYVWLNSKTGEVNELTADGVPGAVHYETYGNPYSTPAPLENGRPWMWGMDFAPASFWEELEQKMEEYGVTPENIQSKMDEWNALYGDEAFWPVDCKAIWRILEGLSPEDLNLPEQPYFYAMFPNPEKKSLDEIEAASWRALREAAEGQVDGAWIDRLRFGAMLCSGKIFVNGQRAGRPVWVAQFYDYDAYYGYWATRAWVYLDEDGNVLLAELDLYGNG